MSEQPPEDLPAVALEPDTLPDHPLRAEDVEALLAKEIGLPPPPTRNATMPKDQLTDADMAEHRIAFRNPAREAKTIRAAYIAPDEKHPDMLVFKDSEHRTVYMVSRDETLEVERLDRGEHAGDRQITERAAAQKERIERGFQPTSQVMDRM